MKSPVSYAGMCIGYERLPEGVESWLTDPEEETCGSLRWIGCRGMMEDAADRGSLGYLGSRDSLEDQADLDNQAGRGDRDRPDSLLSCRTQLTQVRSADASTV
jgi:hypothetical protein